MSREQETKTSEAIFHDARLQSANSAERSEQGKYYWTVQRWDDRFWKTVQQYSTGKRVLEIGCFNGRRTLEVALLAREVFAIDIAPKAVEITRAQVEKCELSNVTVLLGDAERLQFDDGTIDTVFCSGVIHHVDTEKALREIYRVLVPGGYAIFREPLAHNPLINAYRRLTPGVRTLDEHPLTMTDLSAMRRIFDYASFEFFGLLSLTAAPLRHFPFASVLRGALNYLDDRLFNNRIFGRYCWQANILLGKLGGKD
jgi:SAM-dependent methyltransferase